MKITFEGSSLQSAPMAGVPAPSNTYTAPQGTERIRDNGGIRKDISMVVKDNEIFDGHGKTARDVMSEAGRKDVALTRNYLTVMSNILSGDDMARLMKEGYEPGSMPVSETVTIIDKIKATLVQSGVDIEGFTDTLDDETLDSITGNKALSAQLKDSFYKEELPLTEDTARTAMEVLDRALGLTPLTDDHIRYMVENQLSPTVDNIYSAEFSGTPSAPQLKGYYREDAGYLTKRADIINWDSLRASMDAIIEKAGLRDTEGAFEAGKWLIEQGIPLTPENLTFCVQAKGLSLPPVPATVFDGVAAALVDGRSPLKANLADTSTSWDKAMDLYERTLSLTPEDAERAARIAGERSESLTLNHMFMAHRYNIDADSPDGAFDGLIRVSDISELSADAIEARRRLEEIRLSMTLEANRELIRSGFSIDTAPIEETIKALKAAEDEINRRLFGPAWDSYVEARDQLTSAGTPHNNEKEKPAPAAPAAASQGTSQGTADQSLRSPKASAEETFSDSARSAAPSHSTDSSYSADNTYAADSSFSAALPHSTDSGNIADNTYATGSSSAALPPSPADIFRETLSIGAALPKLPAALLGDTHINEDTLPVISDRGRNLENAYRRAGEQYELLGTSVRRDLGDSIRQAFRNVDDILLDMELPVDESNRRAIRILGYNRMELSEANILAVKEADQAMRTLIDRMSPGAVLRLIREGLNPLTMTVAELNNQLSERRDQDGEREKFARFICRLEQKKEITEAEKESYIGIYRLVRQIEKSDGEVIGSLVNQGAELSFKNLLSALRSKKSRGMDFAVDDNTGARSEIRVADNSIERQIYTAYDAAIERELYDRITNSGPDELAKLVKEPETTIESFLWNNAPLEEEAYRQENEAYIRQKTAEAQSLADIGDDEIRLLEFLEEPATATNLMAMNAMFKNGGANVKRLREYAETSGESDRELLREALEIGESFDDPESAEKAIERFTQTAKELADSVLNRGSALSSEAISELGLIYKQLSFTARLSRSEQYDIPIVTDDEVFTLHLKVQSAGDEEQRGRIEASMELPGSGMLSFRLKAADDSLSGIFTADTKEGESFIASLGEALADTVHSLGFSHTDIYTGLKSFRGESSQGAARHYREPLKAAEGRRSSRDLTSKSPADMGNDSAAAASSAPTTRELYRVSKALITVIRQGVNRYVNES